ncbi:HIT family protein [Patescibacteria group bacterium]|nr:HIT family protein [Patescibacteria group bacterium]
MNKKTCSFCGFDDKAVTVYEDEVCFAIVSENPINKHHVLVIPKKHYESFIELPDKLAVHIFLVAKKLSKAVREACNPDAITHLFDDDVSKSGYNMVPHYKFHIIPRFKKDMHMIDWGQLRTDQNYDDCCKYAKGIKDKLR